MDFVKREDRNMDDDEGYKAYAEAMQKSVHHPEMDYQHTPISMEQLHQAMQNSLTASTLAHNFALPLSPRQMSTLMLKTNHLSRNLHLGDISAHIPRNLSSEIELTQNLNDIALAQSLARNHHHEDILSQNLSRNLPHDLRNLSEIDLQHNIGLSHNLSQAEFTKNLVAEISQNLNRNDVHLTENLSRADMMQNLDHELDLSHHLNRTQNLQQDVLDESRRTPIAVQCVPDTLLDQNLGQRLVNGDINIHDANQAALDSHNQNEHILPMPFHIKSEQEEDGYFYDSLNHGYQSAGIPVSGIPGNMSLHPDQNQVSQSSVQQDSQVYATYNNHMSNLTLPSLPPVNLYQRAHNYVQNYAVVNIAKENPQNLVVHRQYDNHSPYPQENFKQEQDVNQNGAKIVKEKEHLKVAEGDKIYYSEYNQSQFGEKNENDASEPNKIVSTDDALTMNIKGEYMCYKCNELYPTKRGLKQHSKTCAESAENSGEVHEKPAKFTCSLCPYRCQSPAILKIHERTHTGEKPFSCTFCDYKSGQKNNVAKHILVHMKEKPFRCQYCEYRCAQKNNLVVHERTHTGFKPFACPYCDYRTVQKPNLVKHMYLHTDQKPFSCDQCTYRCVQKTNLTKHKLRHLHEKDGEKVDFKSQTKPYRPRQKKCPQCPYRCVQIPSLIKHIKFKHSEQSIQLMEYLQESNESLNLMTNSELNVDEIQNLSVKRDAFPVSECQEKVVEPLQIQS